MWCNALVCLTTCVMQIRWFGCAMVMVSSTASFHVTLFHGMLAGLGCCKELLLQGSAGLVQARCMHVWLMVQHNCDFWMYILLVCYECFKSVCTDDTLHVWPMAGYAHMVNCWKWLAT
ncbi:unnamed protein product [Lathyrus oleraceus]